MCECWMNNNCLFDGRIIARKTTFSQKASSNFSLAFEKVSHDACGWSLITCVRLDDQHIWIKQCTLVTIYVVYFIITHIQLSLLHEYTIQFNVYIQLQPPSAKGHSALRNRVWPNSHWCIACLCMWSLSLPSSQTARLSLFRCWVSGL